MTPTATTPITITCAATASHPNRILLVAQAGANASDGVDLTPLDAERRPAAEALARARGFTGKAGETLLFTEGAAQWLLAGLGEADGLTRPRFAEAVAGAFANLRAAGGFPASLILPERLPWDERRTARSPRKRS